METTRLKADIEKGEINITVDDRSGKVSLYQYCKRKAAALVEFGYPDVTADEIEANINKLANGEEVDVVGMFVEKDLNYPLHKD